MSAPRREAPFIPSPPGFDRRARRELLRSASTSCSHDARVDATGITASVGSVADAYDNAMAETFVAPLERELVAARRFATRFEAEIAIFEDLGWFNDRRLHSELDYVPPAELEAAHHTNYSLIT